ncbi:MAG: orotidine 5'-phosphate decarboxylase [Candidatus Pacebacteria bacterium]|nr:orotidine 5'-phosphate decarboxylase [Candidatus Paceibacterota bacterium]MCF7857649.1 orotidine 5'-phosphate decarboxylase [Candidatus Paceibacterota bacterium]
MKTILSLAADGMSLQKAYQLATTLRGIAVVKMHSLLDALGPMVLTCFELAGVKCWVDYKLHDTKDTVGLRVGALVKNGAKIITVHASGGVPMMKAAVEATMSGCDEPVAEIYVITVLTSLDDAEIARIYGKDRTRLQIVEEFVRMAQEAGVRNIVCSALELEHLKSIHEFAEMKFTIPGTRSVGADLGQQKRSDTPGNTVANGADGLVVGSQVTKAEDRVVAMDKFLAEVSEGEKRQAVV